VVLGNEKSEETKICVMLPYPLGCVCVWYIVLDTHSTLITYRRATRVCRGDDAAGDSSNDSNPSRGHKWQYF
jgi:hypothetical protein